MARRGSRPAEAFQALQGFPPPEAGVLYLVGDSTLKGKCGSKPPGAQNTRLSQPHASAFGFWRAILMTHEGAYHIPVNGALVPRKGDPGS